MVVFIWHALTLIYNMYTLLGMVYNYLMVNRVVLVIIEASEQF